MMAMDVIRFLACVLSLAMFAVQGREAVYVDEGACPGEGCGYGRVWRATAEVSLRETPNGAVAAGKLPEGKPVCTVTGEVHTVPGHFVVKRRHERYQAGDILKVYTYQGEGTFLVEFEGERYIENLRFSPWGGSAGSRCELSPGCWGELETDLEFEWWILVDTLDGTTGWTKEYRAFAETAAVQDPEFHRECKRRLTGGRS